MKKIKFDRVKDFLFDHGEKVALGTCVFLALMLGALGIFRAMGAAREQKTGEVWHQLFAKEQERLRAIMSRPKQPDPTEEQMLKKALSEESQRWLAYQSQYLPTPYVTSAETNSGKRDRPKVLPINNDPKSIDLQYFSGLVLTHEYGTETVKGRSVNVVRGLIEANPAAPGMIGVPQGMPIGPAQPFMRVGTPTRMVVGTMVFPMRKQVVEYMQALRMNNQTELFASKEDLPKPLGFTLIRMEIGPDGNPQNAKRETLVQFDPRDSKVTMAKSIKDFLRSAMYDETFPEIVEGNVFMGLTMPTPKLGNGQLAKFDLPGITPDWSKLPMPKRSGPLVAGGEKDPKKGSSLLKFGPKDKPKPKADEKDPLDNVGVDGKVVLFDEKELKTSNPTLASRLFDGKYNIFHALGQLPPPIPVGPKGVGTQQPFPMVGGMPGQQGRFNAAWDFKPQLGVGEEINPMQPPIRPMGEQPGGIGGQEIPDWNRDAIVRFIDPEVEPGKTYAYALQVYFANPNFQKQKQVAFEKLAVDPVLPPSAWTMTPTISIPGEYHLYAVDQELFNDSNPKSTASVNELKALYKDSTTFQIHKWLKKHDDLREEYIIGDWAVAERLVVRKGDYIGASAIVEVPVWRKMRNIFEIPRHTELDARKKNVLKPGLRMNLNPPGQNGRAQIEKPVLVDFVGGKLFRGNSIVVGRSATKTDSDEEVAVDALVLHADGRLEVLHAREHSELGTETGRERHRRLMEARQKVEEAGTRPALEGMPMPGGAIGN